MEKSTDLKYEDLTFKEPNGAEILAFQAEVNPDTPLAEAYARGAAAAAGVTLDDIKSLCGTDFWKACEHGKVFISGG